MRRMSRNALTLLAGLIAATFGATPALADPTAGVMRRPKKAISVFGLGLMGRRGYPTYPGGANCAAIAGRIRVKFKDGEKLTERAATIRKSPCASTSFTLWGLVFLALTTFVVLPHKAKAATLIGDVVTYDLTITHFDFSVSTGSGVATVGAGIDAGPPGPNLITGISWLALDVMDSSFELVYDDVVNRAVRKLEFTLSDLDFDILNVEIVNATFAINDLNGAAASITTTADSVSIVLDNTDGNFFVWEIGDRLVVDIEVIASPPSPTVGLLYDIDFNSVIAPGPPILHAPLAPAPRFGPTFTAGSPTVEKSHGPLTLQPVVLNDTDLVDDRLQLLLNDFPGGLITDGTVTLEMDLSIDPGGGLPGRFEIIFIDDAFNLALDIRFDLLGNVFIGEGGAPPPATSYSTNTKIAVRAEINTADDTFAVSLDGISVSSGTFATPLNQINQITFRVFKSTTTIVTAAIDNILISVEPSSPLPVISDPDVVAALDDIGAETLGCGSAAPEPLPGICEIPILVTPDVQVRDCRGFPNECEAFLAENPQIILERPTGLKMIYFPGSSCTKIYFTFLGTEYEICEELLF